MKPGRRAAILLVLLLLLVSVVGTAAAKTLALEVTRSVISSGGGHVEAGDMALHTTIGQPLVHVMGRGSYGLCSGFWIRSQCIHKFYLPLMLRNF
jgi:hypothetical protein